jgi:fructose-1,6-bisphosphatase II
MNVPGNVFYMNKIAVGPDSVGAIDINASVAENLANVAKAKGKKVENLTVVVLDRPRHKEIMEEIRAVGARIKLITDGDIVGGIQAALPGQGVDMLLGIGGSPEAVLTAAAIRCIGGEILCKAWPRDDDERKQALADGVDLDKVYDTHELVGGEDVFFSATGASKGDFLKGVTFVDGGAETQSLVMRSRSGTVRWIDSIHDFSRLDKIRFQD